MGEVARIPVGTHYRVWWFWLPIIAGGTALLVAAVVLPIFPRIGIAAGCLCVVCLVWATLAGLYIERGRQWVELTDAGFRLCDHSVQTVIADEQVTDLALRRQPHHGAGRLLAETRQLTCWIDTDAGSRRIPLTSRMAPGAADPLQPLIDRLRRRLGEQALQKIAARETIDGEGWALDATQLHISTKRHSSSIPLDEITAVETIGQEVRIWQLGSPYPAVRLPLAGRNTWLLERLLTRRLARTRPSAVEPTALNGVAADRMPAAIRSETADIASRQSPMGRILFERTAGPGPTVLLGVMGMLLAIVGGTSLWVAIQGRDPLMSAIGGLLVLLSGLCLFGGIRVRRVRFRCFEWGLERITMTSHRVLLFEDIDVFSFESRRNQSHGRYTGTTYTLVFADRSREQGRGIFYSTTVRNDDPELSDLRDRVSQLIARRMAQTFAGHHSVQWTPEIWFRRDALEYTRNRRVFTPAKVVVVPYDTITDVELRDGLFHIWTSYQDRAVLSVNAGAPNFYPGQILLEGLARTTKAPLRELKIKS